jgi:hypothetical protein
MGLEPPWSVKSQDNTPARRMYAAAGGREEDESLVMVTFNRAGDACS